MIVTGYTDENGTVIPEEDATEYIWKQARNNEEDKTWLLEYMWTCLQEIQNSKRN